MNCDDLQRQLREDPRRAEDPVAAAHLQDCLHCARLAAEVAGLALLRDDDGGEGAGPGDGSDELLAEVEVALAAEQSPPRRLRALPTRLRVALVSLAALAIPLLFGGLLLRSDVGFLPEGFLVAHGAAVVAPLLAVVALTCRPLFRPGRQRARWLTWLAVAVVVAVALAPAAHQTSPYHLLGAGEDLVRYAKDCLLIGLGTGLPAAVAVVLFDRSDRAWLGHGALAAAVAGALAGNLTLLLHCPLVSVEHRLAGHATVLLPFLVLPALATVLARRARHPVG